MAGCAVEIDPSVCCSPVLSLSRLRRSILISKQAQKDQSKPFGLRSLCANRRGEDPNPMPFMLHQEITLEMQVIFGMPSIIGFSFEINGKSSLFSTC